MLLSHILDMTWNGFEFFPQQVKLVKKAFDAQREFIVLASKSQKPNMVSLLRTSCNLYVTFCITNKCHSL